MLDNAQTTHAWEVAWVGKNLPTSLEMDKEKLVTPRAMKLKGNIFRLKWENTNLI